MYHNFELCFSHCFISFFLLCIHFEFCFCILNGSQVAYVCSFPYTYFNKEFNNEVCLNYTCSIGVWDQFFKIKALLIDHTHLHTYVVYTPKCTCSQTLTRRLQTMNTHKHIHAWKWSVDKHGFFVSNTLIINEQVVSEKFKLIIKCLK